MFRLCLRYFIVTVFYKVFSIPHACTDLQPALPLNLSKNGKSIRLLSFPGSLDDICVL